MSRARDLAPKMGMYICRQPIIYGRSESWEMPSILSLAPVSMKTERKKKAMGKRSSRKTYLGPAAFLVSLVLV